MIKHGYSVNFEGNHCTIFDPEKKEIARVKMQNKSFSLKWNDSIEEANKDQSDETWLWHKRYGHYNIGALKLIHQRDIVRDLPSIHDVDSLCEACQLSKQHKKHFPTESTWRAKEKLELAHRYLWTLEDFIPQ